jgi:hypothetical protein
MSHRQNFNQSFLGMQRSSFGMYGDHGYVQPSLTVQQPIQQYTMLQSNAYHQSTSSANSVNRVNNASVAINQWWPMYSKALYILARTINVNDVMTERAVRIFVFSLVQLLPNEQVRQYVKDFMEGKQYTIDMIIRTNPTLFATYPTLENNLRYHMKDFITTCCENADGQSLLLFFYLLHMLLVSISANAGISMSYPKLNEVRNMYDPTTITIEDWGSSIWFMLHTCSLYAPEPLEKSFTNYRNMLYSLQYLLPCPKCRDHLSQNLKYIDLLSCPRTRQDLFRCSWQLHNIVNQSREAPEVSFQEAIKKYTF